MQLTYKYRLNPTSAQRTALNATLDACRWVYNKTLEVRKEAWEPRKESVSYYDSKKLIPTWKAEHPFLTQAHSQVLQNAGMRVDLALQAFFRRVRKGETPVPGGNPPRFRHQERYDSFTLPQYESGWKWVPSGYDSGRLRLFKIGDVKIKLHLPSKARLKPLLSNAIGLVMGTPVSLV